MSEKLHNTEAYQNQQFQVLSFKTIFLLFALRAANLIDFEEYNFGIVRLHYLSKQTTIIIWLMFLSSYTLLIAFFTALSLKPHCNGHRW